MSVTQGSCQVLWTHILERNWSSWGCWLKGRKIGNGLLGCDLTWDLRINGTQSKEIKGKQEGEDLDRGYVSHPQAHSMKWQSHAWNPGSLNADALTTRPQAPQKVMSGRALWNFVRREMKRTWRVVSQEMTWSLRLLSWEWVGRRQRGDPGDHWEGEMMAGTRRKQHGESGGRNVSNDFWMDGTRRQKLPFS